LLFCCCCCCCCCCPSAPQPQGDCSWVNDRFRGTPTCSLPGLLRPHHLKLYQEFESHWCPAGTDLKYYQGFILLTNYQRYIDEFITWGQKQVIPFFGDLPVSHVLHAIHAVRCSQLSKHWSMQAWIPASERTHICTAVVPL
jgi:hypothetical protein